MIRSPIRAVALLLFALSAAGLGWWTYARAKSPLRPNVLVLLLDTTRADHLGVLGYERDTSPNIDRWARENLCFTRAFTEATWTPPSVATLFSGLWASAHGMMPPDEAHATDPALGQLDERVLTMAEILQRAGYRTAAVSSNPWITPEFGYGQGFESYTTKPSVQADEITNAGLAAVDELCAGSAPFFLYMHYLDPHKPYRPPKEYDTYSGELQRAHYTPEMLEAINAYDGEIRYLDASLGRLFEGLKARGVYEDLVIVLLSDHGEQFEEHGFTGHGWQLFNEELHVPLVVKPGHVDKGRSSDRVVSIIDVLPTVLDLANVARPPGLPGLNLLDDGELAARRGVFAEIDRRFWLRAYVNAAGQKLVVGSSDMKEKFDPAEPLKHVVGVFEFGTAERVPVEDAALRRELESEFVELLKRVEAAKITPSSRGVVPSEETIRHLNNLGYVK